MLWTITDNQTYPGIYLTILAALLALPIWAFCLYRQKSMALSTTIAIALTLPITAYAVHAGNTRGKNHHITPKDNSDHQINQFITAICKAHKQ